MNIESALISGVVILLIFVAFSYFLEKVSPQSFSFTYSVSSSVISTAIVVPFVFTTGSGMYRDGVGDYYEFWNGLEVEAFQKVKECERDGICVHEYDCDPYPVVRTRVDSEGNLHTETETEWHSCPYATHEVSYVVSDTLGNDNFFGRNQFLPNPQEWREGSGIPSRVPTEVPQKWLEAKERIESGRPGGVTEIHSYKNWILPLQNTVLERYSDKVSEYVEASLLPVLANETHDIYHADKVYDVDLGDVTGWLPKWQEELQRFNGRFGSEKQGDLHVVLVNSDRAKDPDSYSQALNSVWLNTDVLGANTLSKNGVVIVMGVSVTAESGGSVDTTQSGVVSPSEQKVDWVRAFTGMPEGNEKVVSYLQSPAFVQTASELFNEPEKLLNAEEGLKHLYDGYIRVNMKDYEYLKDSFPVSAFANVVMGVVSFILSAILVWLAYYVRHLVREEE